MVLKRLCDRINCVGVAISEIQKTLKNKNIIQKGDIRTWIAHDGRISYDDEHIDVSFKVSNGRIQS